MADNGHGGRRAGAGRKPGQSNRKTRAVADRAAADGVTPLEVMLKAMREHYAAGRWDDAAAAAKDAAPYCHPRLSSVEVTGQGGGPVHVEVSPADRLAALERLRAAVGEGA